MTKSHARRRALIVAWSVLATIATVCSVVAPQGKPAIATPAVFRPFQHAIQLYNDGAIDYISNYDPPLMITGQQFCRQAYDPTKLKLISRGYIAAGRTTVYNSPPCGGSVDGEIVLVASKGTHVQPTIRQPFAHQDPNDGTLRSYVCVGATFYLRAWWTCSTHITPNSEFFATAQADEMRSVAAYLNDRPVIVGGDFNRQQGQSGPAAWYNGFHESDEGAANYGKDTFDNDHGLYKKIDYIFSGKLRTDAAYGVARVGCGNQTGSDHCFIHGTHRFL
ncbi:MAG: endonuclease/exonuclease/phosphatase family protein [Iamia sp.]